jgi:outer membrane autotransporter protein
LTGSGTLTNTITNFGAGSALNIASGANWIASGNWSIAAVTNAGLFQAGTATTPLQLTGNFTQLPSATLQVSVGGNGNASKFVIDGAAALAGTLALVPATGSFTMPDARYTILTASGGVSGAFSHATFTNALLAPNLTFDPNDVVVTFTQLPVSAATSVPFGGGTPNQRATAAALDNAVKANPAAFAATLAGLDQMTAPQVRASLDRLSGENHASLPTIALLAGEQFVNQFQQQSTLARLGDSATAAGRDAAAAGGRQQLASLSGAPSRDPWANLSLPWGIWAAGYGQTGHLDGDGNTHGLSESVTGAAVGADYKVNPALRVGLAVGYGSAAYSLDNGGGSGDVNYTQAGVYSGYTKGPVYLDGMVGVAVGDGSSTRDASLPGSPAQAHADVSSTEVLGGIEAGYRLPLTQALTLTPFAGLSFGTVWQNSFTESGAGARDLATQNQSQSSVKSTLGARLAADVPVSRWLVASSIQVGWSHEFASPDRSTTASFVGLPSTEFTVAGARVPGNSAMVAVGLSTRVSAGGSFNLHYDGYFSGSGSSNAVTGSFRYVW